MNQPNYYAIIPSVIRYDVDLCPNAKLLYGEITALCSAEGFCWSENGYFAKLYNVKTETISRWISMLEKKGFIKTDLNKIEGNKRKIFIVDNGINLLTKKSIGIDKKVKRVLIKKSIGIDEKVKSIYDNTTINNTSIKENDALAFFEKNYPIEFESLMMKFKSQIKDYLEFAKMFDATVEQEGLAFDLHVLSGRFKKYALAWIRNQGKFDGKVVEMLPNNNSKVGGF